MVAQALADRLSRRVIRYGWVIVAVTFLTSLTMAGAMGLPGAPILALSREFGWNIAEISSAIGIRLVLFGLMAPVAAALIESYGVRRIVIAAITLIVSGLLLALAMTHVWHLVLLWGIVVGIGTGMTALVLGATDRSSGFKAEPERYHFYVAHGCPRANLTLICRALKKLDGLISAAYAIPGLIPHVLRFEFLKLTPETPNPTEKALQ
jgi:hypothetical protein